MTKPKFTPGPWRYAKNSNISNLVEAHCGRQDLYEEDNGYRSIAAVQSCCASQKFVDQEENQRANIALIAAAPDLYEALHNMVKVIDGLNIVISRLWVNDANRALAKARGEG